MKVATRYRSGKSDGELLIAAGAGDRHALEEIPGVQIREGANGTRLASKSDGPSGHAGCAVFRGAEVPEFAMKPTVYVVDDDACIREALDEMLTLAGMGVVTCASAGDYFRVPKPDLPSCLILDVALPDGSGIDLQRQLSTGDHPPIIFLTGAGDIPTAVRAIKAGAIDFLTKPWRKADLLAAIETAIAQDCNGRAERVECMRLKYRHSCLTPREREVLPLVVGGLLNKEAAAELGISETTLQLHRSRVMRKMEAESLAQLVRMAAKLAVPLPRTKSH
jgi:FixJ family two-component response regulator